MESNCARHDVRAPQPHSIDLMRYDLIAIGSGPAGQKGAIAASKLGKRVAIVERQAAVIGGVCLHTGTIPSKTMREAILHLTGFRQRDVYVEQYRKKQQITMNDLRRKLNQVIQDERQVIEDRFHRNGIDVYTGTASFVSPHDVAVTSAGEAISISGDHILIAAGTKPARPAHIPFDGVKVFDSDEVLAIDRIPRSMIVVGGGVIGIEYAIMFATLGVHVTVIDGRDRILTFCDREIIDSLLYHCRSLGMAFRLGEEVTAIRHTTKGAVVVELESQKRVIAETVLYCAGRQGDTEELNLTAAGLAPDSRGRLKASVDHQTEVPHIYAVGDIIGFPALASTSMEQGRRAVAHAFHQPFMPCEEIPYGLFTIPEISMVGPTEEDLTKQKVPYEVGVAHYWEVARGQIAGDQVGMLKLLFHRESLRLLAVHCIGETATEIIHIGQAVIACGGTIDYFCNTVFNYPTMAECYKVAAFDGRNRACLDDDAFDGNNGSRVSVEESIQLLVAGNPQAVTTPQAVPALA